MLRIPLHVIKHDGQHRVDVDHEQEREDPVQVIARLINRRPCTITERLSASGAIELGNRSQILEGVAYLPLRIAMRSDLPDGYNCFAGIEPHATGNFESRRYRAICDYDI